MLEANLNISDGTLVFTRGAPHEALAYLIEYAAKHTHPCLHVDFDKTMPLQAAFKINVWGERHSIKALHVTGSLAGTGIYADVSQCMHSALMLGKEEYPGLEQFPVEKKPIPRTVEEAVAHLIEVVPLKDKVHIANMSADEISDLNRTLGNYIRDKFELWSGNENLKWSCSKEVGKKILHEDEASSIIIARLALELEKTHKLRTI